MAKTSFYSGSGTNSTDVAAIDSLKTAAEAAKTAAETAQAAAETAEANAETSATNAASSATSVSTSASTATTKASEAAASASTATTKASEASTSASTATTKASEAAASASSASTSASTATTKASEASTSATNAATSETNAASSATSASTSASTATTKASEASTSASTATTKASEAATSATNASTSASTATTKASEAATSASTATTKASEASASATAAASSATSASSAQTAAESARDSALASFDSFDDRYLGAKSSEPSVDNDGNALVGGSLFFDTTASSMKVYTGSAWVSAYTSLSGALLVANNLSDVNSAATSATNLGLGTGNTPTFAGATVNGNIAVTGTVDGRDIAAMGIKLDGIEASADVTDTANVTAAGALMDSELADVSAVKGINQALTTSSSPTFGTVTADGLTVETAQGDISIPNSSTTIEMKRAGTNYIYATDASGNLRLGSGGVLNRLNIANNGDISFYEDTGTTAKFFWDASAENLGIGTSSVGSKLTIDGNGNGEVFKAQNTSGSATMRLVSSNTGVNYFNFQDTDGVGGQFLYNHTSNYLAIKTNNTERMRINSSGQVGIGTSSPTAKLEVSGTPNATIQPSNAIIKMNSSGGNGLYMGNIGASSYASYIQAGFVTADSPDVDYNLLLQPNGGNVGIGESDPDSTLTVKGASHTNFQVKSNSESTKAFIQTVQDSDVRIGSSTNHPVTLYQNGTERMRIDNSGNLLVGDASATFNDTAKTVIRPSSDNWTIKPAVVHSFNRTGSDGDILEFYRTSSTKVGSIGVASSDLTIFSTASGHSGLRLANGYIAPTNNSGTISDATADLGISNYRFKDLWLSGGVYLGGTGAANKLDDYEEGVYQATLTTNSGSVTLNSQYQHLQYVKVGKVVHLSGRLNISSVSSPSGAVKVNLPFTTANESSHSGYASLQASWHHVNLGSGGIGAFWEVPESQSYGVLCVMYNNAQWYTDVASNLIGGGDEWLYVSGSYMTA